MDNLLKWKRTNSEVKVGFSTTFQNSLDSPDSTGNTQELCGVCGRGCERTFIR